MCIAVKRVTEKRVYLADRGRVYQAHLRRRRDEELASSRRRG
jgi:hypothetical protein